MAYTIQLDAETIAGNTNDCFEIYQLKDGQDYHALRFASLSELEIDAQQFRSHLQDVMDASDGLLFQDKAEVEAFLRSERFQIVPNQESNCITVRNQAQQEATVTLGLGESHCWTESFQAPKADQSIRKEHYNLVYTGVLLPGSKDNAAGLLEHLYVAFNLNRPDDFNGHSLSVSDVIVLKQDGRTNSYYIDSFGFRELPGFDRENPLRNAEIALEDDYGMIDGMINNGPRQESKTDQLDLHKSVQQDTHER